jgi:hypothetical protein
MQRVPSEEGGGMMAIKFVRMFLTREDLSPGVKAGDDAP